MYNATNTGKEANAYLILCITMLPIFENTNFTAVDDFLRLTIPDIHNSDWKIFSDISPTWKFVKYTFYCSPPKISLERLKLET